MGHIFARPRETMMSENGDMAKPPSIDLLVSAGTRSAYGKSLLTMSLSFRPPSRKTRDQFGLVCRRALAARQAKTFQAAGRLHRSVVEQVGSNHPSNAHIADRGMEFIRDDPDRNVAGHGIEQRGIHPANSNCQLTCA